ncbi:type I secretion system permease/ATPase [Hyphomicrobium sp.]|uniref:type I secretion system permease/ATPase n=1 Tax=Hyphomicrobium sp. TaxID=82 RepID=UPI003F72D127
MKSNALSPALASALAQLKGVFWTIVLLSGVINLLALTGAFYMLQVYNRVLASGSVPTLLALSALALGLFVVQGVLDIIRGQLLVRIAGRVDRRLTVPAHSAAIRMPLYGRSTSESLQPLRDVEAIRSFVGGQSLVALIDLPWFPLYLGFVFLLHVSLGWLATFGAVVLIGLTVLTEWLTRDLGKSVSSAAVSRLAIAEANVRNAEVLRAMGFGRRALDRFEAANAAYLAPYMSLSDTLGVLGSISKILRMILQSAILGLGAYLVLAGEVTAGAIIAASIASARALAPIELAIANWKVFAAARQSHARLGAAIAAVPTPKYEPLPLPPPTEQLSLDAVTVPVPGTQHIVLNNISFALRAGQGVGIIGPSAAGKSTLARAMIGVWPLARGAVRLDGAALDRWSEEALGRHVGYLPQDVELFAGTIAENIARFEANGDPGAVIAAAKAAQVHDMILGLSEGYETPIGDRGSFLSAGQRQRIALARALYGTPFLVVLDEPNSNLDADGEAALVQAIENVRARGGIVAVVAHRPSVLAAVDMVAVIGGGMLTAFGPRDDVLRRAVKTPVAAAPVATLSLVSDNSS